MANGNPSDVGYQPQGVPESLISGLINRKSKGAEGLNALNQSSLFPALQQTIQQIAQANQKKKQQEQMQQLIQQLNGQQSMSQIPSGQPMSAGLQNVGQDVNMPKPQMPAATSGQAPQPFNGVDPQKLLALYMKADPQGAQELIGQMIRQKMSGGDQNIARLNQMYPQFGGALNNQNLGQLLPSVLKNKPPLEWSAISGMTDKDGNPIEIDKTTGEIKVVPIKGGTKSTGFGATMGPIRKAQFTLQDLPSNQGPSTAGGAAYQVLVGSQQGMNLIARAGSTQRTGLAQGDLARTILRNSPTDEALRNANFSENMITRFGQLKQNLTADPSALANPKIRQEMYNIFKEMRASSRPFIENQLNDMADAGFPVTEATRKRQLGDTLPVIPFQNETPQSKEGNDGWAVVR